MFAERDFVVQEQALGVYAWKVGFEISSLGGVGSGI